VCSSDLDQSAPADNRWLAQALDQPRPDVPQIAAHLGALIDVLSYPAAPDAAAAEQRLRDILAQPPFAQPERSDKPGWLERFLQWLNDLFGSRVVPADHVQPKGSQGISWLITLIGLLTIGAVLAIWLRGLRWASAPLTRRPDEDPEVALSAAEATRQADSLAHSGDYRRAARMLYLSALLWLHEQGRLRYDRSLTNREHLDRLGEQSALRERLRPVIETFDSVWYGDLPLDATSFATYERQVEALRDV
ncbi:MAG: DUF4129 domain-containing protein, partial [Oscillochloris sp.]|nr:DUF4129 domain-containing protein [Oscillochloris sp.]